jgi:hypothetical protein
MTRHSLKIATLVVCFTAIAAPAGATTNLFYPISGSSFVPQGFIGGPFSFQTTDLVIANGAITNISANDHYVEAPLGYAQGGANTFYANVFGNNTSGLGYSFMICSVIASPAGMYNGVVQQVYSGALNVAAGWQEQITLATNFPTGNYFYSIACNIPRSVGGNAAIFGVWPNH